MFKANLFLLDNTENPLEGYHLLMQDSHPVTFVVA